MKTDAKQLLIGLLTCLLVACGGGGTQVAGIDRGGVRGGIAVGVVTGFGSVFVNGVRYTTDAALITVDGVVVTEGELALGQVVAVDAELSAPDAAANTVTVDSNVIGPVAELDAVAGTLTVLGQSVTVLNTTYFSDNPGAAGLDGLIDGDIVRVSGLVDADDQVSATRIDLLAGVTRFEVQGIARDVDTGLQQLMIGGLLVDYSFASMIDGFPGGQPETGDLVRIEGTAFGPAGELIADAIVLRTGDLSGNEDDAAEIEGFITAFSGVTDFEVGGIPVTTDGNTDFEHGNAADLGLNVRVEVEGRVGANGIVLAEEVEFKDDSELRIEANVDAVDVAAGTLVVLGITVHADGLTDLDAINPGDCAKVRGFESVQTPGEVIATRLEREDSCGTTKLRGIVQGVADPELTILGVTVLTDGSTDFEGGSAAVFFAAATGRLVEAKGDVVGPDLLAEQLEFKD